MISIESALGFCVGCTFVLFVMFGYSVWEKFADAFSRSRWEFERQRDRIEKLEEMLARERQSSAELSRANSAHLAERRKAAEAEREKWRIIAARIASGHCASGYVGASHFELDAHTLTTLANQAGYAMWENFRKSEDVESYRGRVINKEDA